MTTSAKWESSDNALAVVNATGLVTIMASGSVSLKATYQNVSGSLQTAVNKLAPARYK